MRLVPPVYCIMQRRRPCETTMLKLGSAVARSNWNGANKVSCYAATGRKGPQHQDSGSLVRQVSVRTVQAELAGFREGLPPFPFRFLRVPLRVPHHRHNSVRTKDRRVNRKDRSALLHRCVAAALPHSITSYRCAALAGLRVRSQRKRFRFRKTCVDTSIHRPATAPAFAVSIT